MKIISKLILFLAYTKNYNSVILLNNLNCKALLKFNHHLPLMEFHYLYENFYYFAKCKHLSNETQ